ncbi:MAG: carbamate kinase [Bacteroidetes bacterium]|nr:carbamate kinase [Bacteroidota bacterium]
MGKLAVIALGGNAIIRSNQEGTIEEQAENVRETLKNLLYLVEDGYNLVITHGNGPQVGNILMRNDAGDQMYNIAQMPLDICVADSQGGIGYLVERELRNILAENGIQKDIVTMITQVIVDKEDPSLQNPTKRIGKAYSKEAAQKLADSKGWIYKESSKRKGSWRRVVASPKPVLIFNTKSIATLAKRGVIVIAVGGGGIPVFIDKNQMLQPVEAVIDKDYASALLASQIGASEFYILTDVPFIYLDFNKPEQRIVEFLNVTDTEKHLEEGQFGEGNMAPKIRAALRFVKNGGEKSVITEATKLEDRSFGSKITRNY